MRLFAHDRGLSVNWVAGADEAGRGCLAGPLVAAAVAFDQSRLSLADLRDLVDLDDSKKRSVASRDQLYGAILNSAAKIAVALRPAAVIDREGLHVTNLGALSDALSKVACPEGASLTDGFSVDLPWGRSEGLVKGDGLSAAIAAASIVAKVVRDRYMVEASKQFPQYGFEGHVGYGTAEHRLAIERYGPTPLHRLSFKSAAYGNQQAA